MAQVNTNTDAYQGRKVGHLLLVTDTADDDSDKTLTVPARVVWQVVCLYAHYNATAVVGNRRLAVYILDDSANVVSASPVYAAQVASSTRRYTFSPNTSQAQEPYAGYMSSPFPAQILPAGYGVRVWDVSAIDPAADDMYLYMEVWEYDLSVFS